MNNVLVIGGSGFIGSHLVERLCLEGYNVAVLVRKNSPKEFLMSLGVELRSGDLLNPDSLKKVFFGIDAVFCMVNVKPDGKSPQEYEKEVFRLHIDGTRNLLEACRINNVRRLIYFSSVAAMGYEEGISFYDESFQGNPVSVYDRAKLEAEKVVKEALLKKEIDITILRPPAVFGERGLGPLKKIIFFVEKGIVPIIGSGRSRHSISYVGNVVNQAVFLAKHPRSIGKTYITSDLKPYRVNELVDGVSKAMHKRPLKVYIPLWPIIFYISILNSLGKIFLRRELLNKESFVAIANERIFSGLRIFKELGYQEKYGLIEGISRTIKWYRKNNG